MMKKNENFKKRGLNEKNIYINFIKNKSFFLQ